MKRYQTILLDFDGTIMDTSEGICNSFDHALREFGLEPLPRADYLPLIGPPLLDTFRTRFGLAEAEARRAMACYRDFYTPTGLYQVAVYAGIPELLEGLRAAGKHVCLATSKPERYALELLRTHGLARHFDVIGGSDMEETRVKKADIIAYVLAQAGVGDPHSCVMVGDRLYDARGASESGMDCIGVAWGFGSREELREAGCIAVAETPPALLALLTA